MINKKTEKMIDTQMKTLEKKSKKIIFFLNFYGIQVALV